jgi:NADPH2:quinone reductase
VRAVRIHEYGPPEVLKLEEVPEPHVGPGDALIESAANGVVYSETQVRAGRMAEFGLAGPAFPYTFGWDVAGTIVAVGPEVDSSMVGRRVIASTAGSGAYAERVVVPVNAAPQVTGTTWPTLVEIPDGLGFVEACALQRQGRIALALIREASLEKGQSVLVTAAAGALGTVLVQLARSAGAGMIVGAAGGAEKLNLLDHLGVDIAVDYSSSPRWYDEVRTATGGGVDVVFDAVGGEVARGAFAAAADGRGRIIVYGFSSGELAELRMAELLRRGLTVLGFAGARFAQRQDYLRGLQAEILDLAAKGSVVPVVGQTFLLEEASQAHIAVEQRQTTGKTLLTP